MPFELLEAGIVVRCDAASASAWTSMGAEAQEPAQGMSVKVVTF
jgi:hypothetical protein